MYESHAGGVDEILHYLHELLPGYLVVAVLVVDGEGLVHLLLVDWHRLVDLVEGLLQHLLQLRHAQEARVVVVVRIEEIHRSLHNFLSAGHQIIFIKGIRYVLTITLLL